MADPVRSDPPQVEISHENVCQGSKVSHVVPGDSVELKCKLPKTFGTVAILGWSFANVCKRYFIECNYWD